MNYFIHTKTNKKVLLTTMLAIATFLTINAQNVNIPNLNFKNALLNHGFSITGSGVSVINSNGDNEIQITEAQAYTGTIDISNISISNLTGLEAFTEITSLKCYGSDITSLDISQNVQLTYLHCGINDLTSLDVSANTSLVTLLCAGNDLTSLDVSSNLALTSLSCNNNQISSIDVSANTSLTQLQFNDNNLTSLNVANGNNSAFSYMYANNNPNLTCIQHDTGFNPASNSSWWKDATATWSTNCSSSSCTNIIHIPDANFKTKLLNHNPVIDTDGDGEICLTEAQAFTGTLKVSNGGGPSTAIGDLAGIEAFTSITTLRCFNNNLSSLDVTNNTALTELHFGGNSVSSIDLSQNTNLILLFCNENMLSSLDLSNNTALVAFDCNNNQLTQLDISQNTSIKQLRCYDNLLTSLNVANGNNTNFDWMTAGGNPNLTCIQHDSGFNPATDPDWTKDSTASWSDDCSVVLVSSITVQGKNGADTVELDSILQMEAMVLPANADDMSYSWSVTDNTGDASINTNGQLIPQAIGEVTVLAAANDGSGVVGSKVITIIPTKTNTNVGIKDVAFENLSIYPNPTSGVLNLNVSETLTSISIKDISGRIIKTFPEGNTQLDISSFTSGIYFLEVANENKKSTIKIIKK